MRRIGFLVSFIFLSITVDAQLSYNLIDTGYVNLPATSIQESAAVEVLNSASTNLIFEWRLFNYSLPPNWTGQICDWIVCHPLLDTTWHSANWSIGAPSKKLSFFVKRSFGAGPGCATAYVEYRELGQPSNFTCLTVTSYANISVCHPLSIRRNEQIKTFSLYPNPARDEINIDLDFAEEANISLHDIYGQLVKSSKWSSFNKKVPLEDLSTGVYVVQLANSSGELIAQKTFVKK